MTEFVHARRAVSNRGKPPHAFLAELIHWGAGAPEEIFAPNATHDVYSSVVEDLGPWTGPKHRRAAMLEVLRVLAGFESSWDWTAGVDVTNSSSFTPETMEAGAWQISYNSRAFGADLKAMLSDRGIKDGRAFQARMKSDHTFAMEYTARLLRHTVNHNGPVKRHEIDRWLLRQAVNEFEAAL